MTDELETIGPPKPEPPPTPKREDPIAWKRDAQGREYITIPGRRGPQYRRGQETIPERIERAGRPKDAKPKGKRKPGPQPDAPKDVDLKQIEKAIADALASPAMLAGLAGDIYLAGHFATQGPRLARNLVVAAEHNPWLRRQLEQMATGGAAAINVIVLVGLAGGVLAYTAPPIIYLFNLPVPAGARLLFELPPSRNGRPTPPPAEPAAAQAA